MMKVELDIIHNTRTGEYGFELYETLELEGELSSRRGDLLDSCMDCKNWDDARRCAGNAVKPRERGVSKYPMIQAVTITKISREVTMTGFPWKVPWTDE
jgi:hypothetical protein